MAISPKASHALQTALRDRTVGNELETIFVAAQSAPTQAELLAAVKFSRGSFYISASAETSIAEAGTYVKAAGTTTSISLDDFTMPADNRLTYTGTPDVFVMVNCAFSMTAAGNSKILGFKIAKNGTVVDSSEIHRKVGTGADIGAAFVQADVSMSTNDYVELFVADITDTTNLTVDYANFFVLGVPQALS